MKRFRSQRVPRDCCSDPGVEFRDRCLDPELVLRHDVQILEYS